MRDNSYDRTVERNYIQKWRFLIREYEAVKAGQSAQFARVGDFYRHHGTCSQSFRKYYNRFLRGGRDEDLLPQRRGPRWKSRRMAPEVETVVLRQRALGLNRYEIYAILRDQSPPPPSPSAIYRAFRRHGVNRLTKPLAEEKRRIIKHTVGELGHADLHRLPRDIFLAPPAGDIHVVSVIDACSRLAWATLVAGKKALPVMFRTLAVLNTLHQRYRVQFAELLTDNGAEFASRAHPEEHPFEAMLRELGIKHRYTRPYRPQTNGKVERFWRTLGDDLIEGTTFDNPEHFATELAQYLIYYNELRPHQALQGQTPKDFAQTKRCP